MKDYKASASSINPFHFPGLHYFKVEDWKSHCPLLRSISLQLTYGEDTHPFSNIYISEVTHSSLYS